MIFTPSRSASLAFEPAPGPAIKRSVLALTDARDLGPQGFGPGFRLGTGHLSPAYR